MFFSFEHLELRYEPFPIGVAKPLMEQAAYQEFLDSFPPMELFEDYKKMGKPGDKYTLSEKENPRTYKQFIKSSPVWREFYDWIKSDAFPYSILDVLRERHIDLGFRYLSPAKRFARLIKEIRRGRLCPRYPKLRARFEFSALPADGGHLNPHTDSLPKVVTMIVSMVRDNEWNPEFGGGTDVNRPKDARRSFNRTNQLANFDDMEVLQTFDFRPNQGVIFVKTFNSWHSVRPMSGHNEKALRKTLTINIEAGA